MTILIIIIHYSNQVKTTDFEDILKFIINISKVGYILFPGFIQIKISKNKNIYTFGFNCKWNKYFYRLDLILIESGNIIKKRCYKWWILIRNYDKLILK